MIDRSVVMRQQKVGGLTASKENLKVDMDFRKEICERKPAMA